MTCLNSPPWCGIHLYGRGACRAGLGRMMFHITAWQMPSGVVFSPTTEDEAKCVYAHL